jgi:sec-independent protein translocase protein TatA
MHLGVGEIALLIVLALILFGAKRLPQVGRAAGEAIREFKSAFHGVSTLKDDVTKDKDGEHVTIAEKQIDGEGTEDKAE